MNVLLLACFVACTPLLASGFAVREVKLGFRHLRASASTWPLPLNVERSDAPDVDGVDPQITGGTDAVEKQFPYQASLQVRLSSSSWVSSLPQHICGGSLIAKNWVMTAAHCIYVVPNNADKVEVVLGIVNLAVKASGSQRITVTRMLAHSKYDHYYADQGVGPYDIGLLKLERDAKLSDSIKIASLPRADEWPTGDGVASGWGWSGEEYPNQLQTAVMPIIEYSDCVTFVEKVDPSAVTLLADSNLCGGPLDRSGISTCSGDSGGPLAQTEGAETVVIGVVSWGLSSCASTPFPSVFTRVSAYVAWIQSVMDSY